MDAAQAPIAYTRESWNEDADKGLSRALGADMAMVRDQVQRGGAALWSAHGCGLAVLRVEGRELVVVAYEGRRLRDVARDIIAEADRHGLELRFHSRRRGLPRLLKGIRLSAERNGDELIYWCKYGRRFK